jgi:hypothetical protein
MEKFARLKAALTGGFTVTERPAPIPGDLRVGWGQSLLLLVLASSRGARCSLQKVHFLAHLSRTERSRRETREVLAQKRSPAELSVRIEPWVNRAAAFGKANGLVDAKNGKTLALTPAGKAAVSAIRAAGILAEETAFLDEIGRFATEQVVDNILKMEAF